MDKQLLESYKAGLAAFKANDYEAASLSFTKVLEGGLEFADVFNMVGVIRYAQGAYAEAVESLHKALELNPNYTEARLNLSVVLNDTGEYPAGAKAFAAASDSAHLTEGEVDPFVKGRLANLHSELGELYHSMGLFDDAMKEYRVALELRDEFPDVRTSLGVLYRDMGLHEQAVVEFDKVRLSHPHYLEAMVQLGITFYGTGDIREAKKLWQAALEADPTHAKATMYLKLVDDS